MKKGELEETETPENLQESYLQLMARAHTYLARSVGKFEEVDDCVNLALIYCNMGRYNRQMADMLSLPLQSDAKKIEVVYQKYYNEAFACYNRALGMLKERKSNPQIWDILYWELSTATFILAQQMQDSWDEKCERYQEIMDLLHRSLKLCQTHSDVDRAKGYAYRTGQINTRFGMVCGNMMRYQSAECDEKKRKNMVQLCRFYYDKAVSIFREGAHLSECIEVLTDLLEFTNSQIDFGGRLKILHFTMNVMKQIKEILEIYSGPEENLKSLEIQCQNIFKNLVKVTISAPNRSGREKEGSIELLNVLKKMYSASLRSPKDKDKTIKDKLLENISTIADIYSELNFSSRNS